MRLQDKVALLTGADSGTATATLLTTRGATATVVGRREAKLTKVVEGITAAGGRALAVAGDVSRREDVQRAAARTTSARRPARTRSTRGS